MKGVASLRISIIILPGLLLGLGAAVLLVPATVDGRPPAGDLARIIPPPTDHRGPPALGVKSGPQRGEEALTVEQVEYLSFGKIVPGRLTNGAVVIEAHSGRKIVRGGVVDVGGHHSRAEFIVRGPAQTRFSIILPQRIVLAGGQGEVGLTDIASSPARVGVIGPDGKARVFVGATLRIQGKPPGGTYQGFTEIVIHPF